MWFFSPGSSFYNFGSSLYKNPNDLESSSSGVALEAAGVSLALASLVPPPIPLIHSAAILPYASSSVHLPSNISGTASSHYDLMRGHSSSLVFSAPNRFNWSFPKKHSSAFTIDELLKDRKSPTDKQNSLPIIVSSLYGCSTPNEKTKVNLHNPPFSSEENISSKDRESPTTCDDSIKNIPNLEKKEEKSLFPKLSIVSKASRVVTTSCVFSTPSSENNIVISSQTVQNNEKSNSLSFLKYDQIKSSVTTNSDSIYETNTLKKSQSFQHALDVTNTKGNSLPLSFSHDLQDYTVQDSFLSRPFGFLPKNPHSSKSCQDVTRNCSTSLSNYDLPTSSYTLPSQTISHNISQPSGSTKLEPIEHSENSLLLTSKVKPNIW